MASQRLLDEVRVVMRRLHYAISTERSWRDWLKPYVRFHRLHSGIGGGAVLHVVTVFTGQGPPRFYLPVDPEDINASYAQLIVNLHDYRVVSAMMAELAPWLEEHYPDAQIPMRKYAVGPADSWQFEVRISGPAEADPTVLRRLGEEGMALVAVSPLAVMVRSD